MNNKRNAVMIADTRPALIGNLLIQINETNKGLFDEAIIYYEKISKKDMKVMESIMPCRFIRFQYELPQKIRELSAFEKFSSLMFSRYYMFDLLDEYETITWIDTDVLICGKLDSIIEKAKITGMSANFEDRKNKSYKNVDFVRTSFKTPLSNYNMNKYNMSSGLIIVSQALKGREKMTKWCFEKTIEYADHLLLPDQGVLNLLIQEFNIDVESVGENGAYCFYPSYKRNSKKAKIIHAWGARKFWKSWYLFNTYPQWNDYYQKWLSLGGSDFFGVILPEVSVIIPMYNPNIEYFNLVLDDLLINQVQDHGFQYDDFEVILVVDGNENDPLLKLLKKYNDPRVKLIINKTRQGIAKSLNIGIKASKGKYIARIDDDDRVSPHRLYKQVQYLNNNEGIHLVTSDFEYFGDMNEKRIAFEKEMAHAWSLFTCPFDHPTIMFRKQFFVENNLFYDESRKYVEDWELWLRAFDKGLVVGSIPEVLYYHRWYNGQAGQNKNTIKMMRELVKKNFAKLKLKLNEEDLKIVSPWQGKIDEKSISHLEEIFLKALENNKKLKLYDGNSLKKAFELRMFEAKNGYIEGVAMKSKKEIELPNKKASDLKTKLLGPVYKPFKRVFYNITAEAVRDNLSNIGIAECSNDEADNLYSKFELFSKTINDKFYDFNKQYQTQRNVELNNLYLEDKIILIGTSEHSNIGDAAITMGEFEFIRKYFKERKIIEVSTYEFFDNFFFLQKIVNPDDLIFLQGGGNLGNKYIVEEKVRRQTIENFPNNKIFILPQTIYFDESNEGIFELEVSKKIYNAHSNLTIFTRGQTSLKLANKHFKNSKHHCTFDSALNLNIRYNFERQGILCCLRDLNDESGLNKEEYNKVIEIIKKEDNSFHYTNNLYDDNISKDIRNKVVYGQLENFAKHQLIVTDRLHGLIFALMTNTPCIVLSSYNYKLNEYTEMLKDNEYVKFIDKDINKIAPEIRKFMSKKNTFENDFSKVFKEIADIINKS